MFNRRLSRRLFTRRDRGSGGGRMSPGALSSFLMQINVFLAGMLAWQCFVVLAVAVYFAPPRAPAKAEERGAVSQPYHTAFLLFWSLAWTAVLFDWVESLYRELLRD